MRTIYDWRDETEEEEKHSHTNGLIDFRYKTVSVNFRFILFSFF